MRQNPHVRICGGPGSATTLVYPTPCWWASAPAHHSEYKAHTQAAEEMPQGEGTWPVSWIPSSSRAARPPGMRPLAATVRRRPAGAVWPCAGEWHPAFRDASAAGPGVCSCSAASACPVAACATIAGRFVSVARA